MAGGLEAALAQGVNGSLRAWVIHLQGGIIVVLGRVLEEVTDAIEVDKNGTGFLIGIT